MTHSVSEDDRAGACGGTGHGAGPQGAGGGRQGRPSEADNILGLSFFLTELLYPSGPSQRLGSAEL